VSDNKAPTAQLKLAECVRGALRAMKYPLAVGLLAGAASAAQAQSADEALTWHGITLYGIVDLGLQYETHGAPFSDYHPAGSANIVQKNSRQSVTGLTPSNLSQSRVGLQGVEPLGVGDWNGVFRLETFFNPQTGELSDAEKSMVINNGKSAGQQSTNLDSSVAGQAFQTIYAGFSSKTYGTITFGRNTGLLADGISKYDPNYASQAFSLIGMSGTYAGGGDTEDRRFDSSLKYLVTINNMFRVGALYKFNGSNGAANTAFQAQVGFDYAGLSMDGYFSKANSAVSASPLSAAQVANGVTVCPAVIPTGVSCQAGASTTNSLAATISDNTAFSVMALYNWDVFKFFAAYEYMKYENPKNPLAGGFTDIGGYNLAIVNNNAFVNNKEINLFWGGVRYTVIPHLDLVGAVYYYHQNAYGTGANAGCSTNASGTCSGHFEAFSFDAVYSFSKRFDGYAGAMYSAVYDGVANGYTFQRNNLNPTVGVRFKF
jgi:predicted porin